MKKYTLLAILLLNLLPIHTTLAAEGRIPLNQVCAERLGCGGGDTTAGFPITISESGSYILTSDLVISTTTTNVIEVTADNVDIDLNGFAIRGPNSCTYSSTPSVSCTYTSGGTGILLDGVTSSRIHNGTISGMPGNGIATGVAFIVPTSYGTVVEQMRIHNNGLVGVTCAECTVSSSLVYKNGDNGLSLLSGVSKGNQIFQNGGVGISGLSRIVHMENLLYQNVNGNLATSAFGHNSYCDSTTCP